MRCQRQLHLAAVVPIFIARFKAGQPSLAARWRMWNANSRRSMRTPSPSTERLTFAKLCVNSASAKCRQEETPIYSSNKSLLYSSLASSRFLSLHRAVYREWRTNRAPTSSSDDLAAFYHRQLMEKPTTARTCLEEWEVYLHPGCWGLPTAREMIVEIIQDRAGCISHPQQNTR